MRFFGGNKNTSSTLCGLQWNSPLYGHILECCRHKLLVKTLIQGLQLGDFSERQIREDQIENATSLNGLPQVHLTIADLDLGHLRNRRVICLVVFGGYAVDCVRILQKWMIIDNAGAILGRHTETLLGKLGHVLIPLLALSVFVFRTTGFS